MTHPQPEDLPELRRMITEALVALERVDEPLARLDAVRRTRELADRLELRAVHDARAGKVSWAKIGGVYGLTKQGAQQRFGERRTEPAASGHLETPPTADGDSSTST